MEIETLSAPLWLHRQGRTRTQMQDIGAPGKANLWTKGQHAVSVEARTCDGQCVDFLHRVQQYKVAPGI